MGRMQSTGHTGTQLASLQQFCVITYATVSPSGVGATLYWTGV
ncbi:MAG: hypothetical protein QOK12_2984 [Mycobacterium sp.]|nr:hypothetical protein [Mycobacterium sp.]